MSHQHYDNDHDDHLHDHHDHHLHRHHHQYPHNHHHRHHNHHHHQHHHHLLILYSACLHFYCRSCSPDTKEDHKPLSASPHFLLIITGVQRNLISKLIKPKHCIVTFVSFHTRSEEHGIKSSWERMIKSMQNGALLTHWGRDKMDAIPQTIFSNAFSWMKMYKFRLKFHWSLFPRVQLTIFQHWFR